MEPVALHYHEIDDLNDPRFLDWLDALQTGFPPDEQMLTSFFLRLLQRKARQEEGTERFHLVAILDDEEKQAGMMMYQMLPDEKVCYLWYILVEENRRSQGLGSRIYREMVQRAQTEIPDLRAVIYEIDRPDQALNETLRVEAERRIVFYRRHGMKIASNLQYHQSVGRRDQPSRLMYLCVHPLQPMSNDEAYAMLKRIFGDDIEPAETAILE